MKRIVDEELLSTVFSQAWRDDRPRKLVRFVDKKLTKVRSSGADEALARKLTLEDVLEYHRKHPPQNLALAISDQELEKGYRLICLDSPLSDVVLGT
jgi:hypothetical protein